MEKQNQQKLRKFAFVLAFCLATFLIVNMEDTYYHENAHHQIDTYFGLESRIHYSPLMIGGKTIPLPNQTIPYDMAESYYLAHSLNEVFGYNIQVLYTAIIFLCGVILWKK